eukprot:315685-Amphidinium_carterae.1
MKGGGAVQETRPKALPLQGRPGSPGNCLCGGPPAATAAAIDSAMLSIFFHGRTSAGCHPLGFAAL